MSPQFNSWVGKIPWRRDRLPTPVSLGFSGGSDSEESTCIVRDLDLIPGLGRSSGGGHGNPLQYSCLESSMDTEHGGLRPMELQRISYNWATEDPCIVDFSLPLNYIFLGTSLENSMYVKTGEILLFISRVRFLVQIILNSFFDS